MSLTLADVAGPRDAAAAVRGLIAAALAAPEIAAALPAPAQVGGLELLTGAAGPVVAVGLAGIALDPTARNAAAPGRGLGLRSAFLTLHFPVAADGEQAELLLATALAALLADPVLPLDPAARLLGAAPARVQITPVPDGIRDRLWPAPCFGAQVSGIALLGDRSRR